MIRFFPRKKSSAHPPLTKRSRPYIIGIASHASVAELVDAQDLGSCALCMGVRVPSLAPKENPNLFSMRDRFGFLFSAENTLTAFDF